MGFIKRDKPCKGTGKAKGYGCGTPQLNRIYNLGVQCRCYSKWLLESEEGKKKLQSSQLKGRSIVVKKIKEEEKQVTRKMRESVTNYKDKLQKEVQLISRLIDKDLTCLARDKFGKMAGGHIFSKGGHAQMRFNLHNIHRQSFASNNCQNDDGLLREKLEIEYGSEYLEHIKGLRAYPVPNYSNLEYKSFYEKALVISNRLKKIDRTYDVNERIKLRNEINIEIGIYSEEQCVFKK
jgi:hypothetical protein